MIGSGRKLLESPTQSPDFRALDAKKSGSAATGSRPALNHDIFRSWNGKQIHLRDEETVQYGFRLSSPQRSPQFYRSNYHSLSPPSKALAIATGQKELMEMVNNMPESCYELSLRDMVEQPMVLGKEEETVPDERDFNMGGDREIFSRENRGSKKEIRALVGRSTGSMENGGLYLKMGFPKSIGTSTKTKKKKKKNDSGLSAKVSPKPSQSVEKDWWKRRLSVSSESESVSYGSNVNNGSIKSSSSGSSNGSNKNRTKATGRHANGGCWSWICPKYDKRDE